jgi:pyruvate/2-oxoglutarate dehydrogenase complex dihydrolipoamide acyltransferase (E2) component
VPDFKLPDLGEGVTEAEIQQWLVKEGQEIAEDDPLVEVITDKATAEIPSPYAGVVAKIHVAQGEIAPVGAVLVTVMNALDFASAPRAPKHEETHQSRGARPTGRVSPPPPPETPASDPEAFNAGGVKAMPPVRKLARDLNVDLTRITGTGPDGRISREDVLQVAGPQADESIGTTHAPPAGSPVERPSAGRREPYRGVRRLIGDRMTKAHLTVPPVTHVEECDVTELDATRKLANERNPELLRLTYMPFLVKAVVAALRDHPAVNASLDEEAGEIVFHDRYDIGIAVDTPQGLVVPIVRDAERKRLREIASDIDRMATAAREGRSSVEDLSGGTFTISSPGPYGGLHATPIVFHPQSAILGVHRAMERPVVRDGQIVIRKIMNLSVTFDHRILDGMTAAKFVLDVAKLLEHPAALALES